MKRRQKVRDRRSDTRTVMGSGNYGTTVDRRMKNPSASLEATTKKLGFRLAFDAVPVKEEHETHH